MTRSRRPLPTEDDIPHPTDASGRGALATMDRKTERDALNWTLLQAHLAEVEIGQEGTRLIIECFSTIGAEELRRFIAYRRSVKT